MSEHTTSKSRIEPVVTSKSSALEAKASPINFFRNLKPSSLGILLFVLVALTFLPSIENDFINYDDRDLVTENQIIQNGFTVKSVAHVFSNVVAANWQPLTCLSHMLDCQLFGLAPWGHHLTSVLIHALNTVLVFLLFRNMTGAAWRSLFVAAIFGLHPLRVESVAWVAERKDVLSALFLLLTLWAYAAFACKPDQGRRSRRTWYGAALVFFCLGLMAKPMLVTLPFVFLLLDVWPLNRFRQQGTGRLVAEKLPFFLLSAAACLVTFLVQESAGAMGNLSLSVRLQNSVVAYCRYLGKLFWPQDLCLPYPHPGNWPAATVLLAVALLAGVTVVALLKSRRYPWFTVGWLWFLGTLVPVIGLVQVGSQSMADRYTYVPCLGILLIITWGICELSLQWRSRSVVMCALALVAISSCIGLTRHQVGYWKNSGTLFGHAIQVTDNNSAACLQLADHLSASGMANNALEMYRKSLVIAPNNVTALNNYALCLLQLERFDEAIVVLQKSLSFKSDDAEVHSNLGAALAGKGRYDEAMQHFNKAIELAPAKASPRINMAIALEMNGKRDEAVALFEQALVFQPDSAFIRVRLGRVLADLGRYDEAVKYYEQGIDLDPTSAQAHYRCALVLLKINRAQEAAAHLRQALKLQPNFPEAEHELHALTGALLP